MKIITFLTVALMSVILVYAFIKPSVSINKSSFDYGEISRKKINVGQVFVENKGILPLEIKNAEGCCGLKVFLKTRKSLKKGEKAKVLFVYNSLEVSPGRFNKTVTINTNDVIKKSLIIPVTGVVESKEETNSL